MSTHQIVTRSYLTPHVDVRLDGELVKSFYGKDLNETREKAVNYCLKSGLAFKHENDPA